MLLEGGDGGVLENQMTEAVAKHETMQVENEKLSLDAEADSILVEGNLLHGQSKHYNYSDNELLLFLLEHDFQNEYMKSQFQGFKIVLMNSDQHGSQNETMKDNHSECHDIFKELSGKLNSLNKVIPNRLSFVRFRIKLSTHLSSSHHYNKNWNAQGNMLMKHCKQWIWSGNNYEVQTTRTTLRNCAIFWSPKSVLWRHFNILFWKKNRCWKTFRGYCRSLMTSGKLQSPRYH